MKIIEILKTEWPKILKIGAIVLGVIILLVFFVNLVVGPVFSQFGNSTVSQKSLGFQSSYAPVPASAPAYDKAYSSAELSVRNAYGNDASAGSAGNANSANFEVMQYNATVETRKLIQDCALVAGLKAKDYIIFQNSTIADRNCSFSFKVEKDKVEEALTVVKSLNPRDFTQNIESIKTQVEDFTSQEEILKNKQASIDDTLKNALAAYDEITDLARKTNNSDSLAKVIGSKIDILERLTNERLQVSASLENLSRQKAVQMDRLKYVNFYVYVYENKILDGQTLKDSWIASVKQFVNDVDQTLKDLSLGLIMILLSVLKYIIYLFLILFAVKLVWKFAKGIWKKQ
jgi:hypothetical protein